MARLTIHAGNHYHGMPPFTTLPWVGKKTMVRTVMFDASCQYDSPAYNSEDVNKLFGLSFGFGGVHGNSARFGWRWSMAGQCIELLAYVYVNGVRNQDAQLRFPVVAQVKPGQALLCSIEATHDRETGAPIYEFEVDVPGQRWLSAVVARPEKLPGYGLTHGLYFGGSLAAPHDMSALINRI